MTKSNLQPNTPTFLNPDHGGPHLLLLLTLPRMVSSRLPGQPVPRFDHSFSGEIFPVIRPYPTLAQPEAVSPFPVPSFMEREPDPHPTLLSRRFREQQGLPKPSFLHPKRS